MKITGIIFIVLVIISLSSCCKLKKEECKQDSILKEASLQGAIILVNSSDYKRLVEGTLERSPNGTYLSGTIKYLENNNLSSKIDFKAGNKADITTNSGVSEIELKKKETGSDYEKVILEPIVKAKDCKYIIAGVIEFYKNGVLAATIDFGDGTCDEWATKSWPAGEYNGKTWPAGSKVFSLNDWK